MKSLESQKYGSTSSADKAKQTVLKSTKIAYINSGRTF